MINELSTEGKTYVLDYRGDRSLIGTSQLSSDKMPVYRHDASNVLGLDGVALKFSKTAGLVLESAAASGVGGGGQGRYFGAGALANTPETLPSMASGSDPFNSSVSFIRHTSSEGAAQTTSIPSKASREESILAKSGALNAQVERDPTDIKSWIALAEHQDEYLHFSAPARRARARMPILEKMIAIYRRALAANPDDETLTLAYLRIAAKLWDTPAVHALWTRVLEHAASSFVQSGRTLVVSDVLWREYTSFQLSNFSEFTVGASRALYKSLIHRILAQRRSLAPRDPTFQSRVSAVERALLVLVAQWARFERQAGYSERAVGLYQALIEFNVFMPPSLASQPHTALLRGFRAFWEADVPRVGESDALGWHQTLVQTPALLLPTPSLEELEQMLRDDEDADDASNPFDESLAPKSTRDDEEDGDNEDGEILEIDNNLVETPPTIQQPANPLSSWANLESERDTRDWMPIKPIDIPDEEADDTERTVLFQDFGDILFRLVREDDKVELVFQFLEFLGVPTFATDARSVPRFSFDHPLRRESINAIQDNVSSLFGSLNSRVPLEGEQPPVLPPWHRAFDALRSAPIDPTRVAFIARVFSLCTGPLGQHDPRILVAYVHFTSRNESAAAAGNICKQLLQKHRNTLELYDAFASFQSPPEARRIYSTALTQVLATDTSKQQESTDSLYRQFAMAEVKSIEDAIAKDATLLAKFIKSKRPLTDLFGSALHVLCCFVEGKYIPHAAQPASRLLIATKNYESRATSTLTSTPDFFTNYCLYTLLTRDLVAATTVFKASLSRLANSSIDHELLATRFTDIVSRVGPIVGSAPRLIKEVIESALERYFDHPLLLGSFLRWELRGGVGASSSRIRHYFDIKGAAHQSTILWLFSIRVEVERLGAGPRIKALFERAVTSPSSRHSIILWRLYIIFESARSRPRASKALYYRAIKELPWANISGVGLNDSLDWVYSDGPQKGQKFYSVLDQYCFSYCPWDVYEPTIRQSGLAEPHLYLKKLKQYFVLLNHGQIPDALLICEKSSVNLDQITRFSRDYDGLISFRYTGAVIPSPATEIFCNDSSGSTNHKSGVWIGDIVSVHSSLMSGLAGPIHCRLSGALLSSVFSFLAPTIQYIYPAVSLPDGDGKMTIVGDNLASQHTQSIRVDMGVRQSGRIGIPDKCPGAEFIPGTNYKAISCFPERKLGWNSDSSFFPIFVTTDGHVGFTFKAAISPLYRLNQSFTLNNSGQCQFNITIANYGGLFSRRVFSFNNGGLNSSYSMDVNGVLTVTIPPNRSILGEFNIIDSIKPDVLPISGGVAMVSGFYFSGDDALDHSTSVVNIICNGQRLEVYDLKNSFFSIEVPPGTEGVTCRLDNDTLDRYNLTYAQPTISSFSRYQSTIHLTVSFHPTNFINYTSIITSPVVDIFDLDILDNGDDTGLVRFGINAINGSFTIFLVINDVKSNIVTVDNYHPVITNSPSFQYVNYSGAILYISGKGFTESSNQSVSIGNQTCEIMTVTNREFQIPKFLTFDGPKESIGGVFGLDFKNLELTE
eukprot:gene4076-4748_t